MTQLLKQNPFLPEAVEEVAEAVAAVVATLVDQVEEATLADQVLKVSHVAPAVEVIPADHQAAKAIHVDLVVQEYHLAEKNQNNLDHQGKLALKK